MFEEGFSVVGCLGSGYFLGWVRVRMRRLGVFIKEGLWGLFFREGGV